MYKNLWTDYVNAVVLQLCKMLVWNFTGDILMKAFLKDERAREVLGVTTVSQFCLNVLKYKQHDNLFNK